MGVKALLTGANGMLADALWPLMRKEGYDAYLTDINGTDQGPVYKVDIRNKDEIARAAEKSRPDIIFHLAAETNVDKCELEPEHAWDTNAKGTENVVSVAKDLKVPLVYISTGAVFDGEKNEPYIETDHAEPISVYGKTKFDGERIVTSLLSEFYIFRAGWMIGGYQKDKKFVAKIIELTKTKKEIPVVTDKRGSPTFTVDFSKGMLAVVSSRKYGLYHMVNEGSSSRFEIAKKIVEYLGREDVAIKPVGSDMFPLPAPRGASEMLANHRLTTIGLNRMRPWTEALREYIEGIE